MSDSSCTEKDGVEEVMIGFISVAQTLSGVEEERNMDTFFRALVLEPEKLGGEVVEGPSKIFLPNKIVSLDKLWIPFLHLDALLHI